MRNLFFLLVIALFASCRKDATVFENNDIPPYGEIATIRVQNYINRIFIDLLGREPVDAEMSAETVSLENSGLSSESRRLLVRKLMTSESFVEGDSTYRRAYYQKVYEDSKARLLDGASDAEISSRLGILQFAATLDSLNGDFTSYERNKREIRKLQKLLLSRHELMTGQINFREMYKRMLDNAVYDEINMNSFNFVNATFDDLFFRFPTEAEFEQAYTIIEYNLPGVVFGEVAQNEGEYLDLLLLSQEYEEGMQRWAYLSLLSREPTSQEVSNLSGVFGESGNLEKLQEEILITDEYAGFD